MFERMPQRAQQIHLENGREMRVELLSPRETYIPGFTPEQVRQLQLPTLLLDGERSPLFLRSITDQLQKPLPVVERVTLAGVSHGLQYEDSLAFNAATLRFLPASNRGRGGPKALSPDG